MPYVAYHALTVDAFAYTAADVQHLYSLDAALQDVGIDCYIVNVEHPFLHSFGEHIAQNHGFVVVEPHTHAFNLPDVAEKLGTQGAIALDNLFDGIQMGINKGDDFFVGGNVFAFSASRSQPRSAAFCRTRNRLR